MLFRFSLYGFLKNQRYFEPFLYLVFMEKGLSFLTIGLLVACREVTVVLLEIPSGAIADTFGRRRAMIISFISYTASFIVFGAATGVAWLFAAMILFGIGESFRTGTHKAIIFSWLRRESRTDDKTRIYGYTRSWSKMGSAVSVLIAMAIVLISDNYNYVFYLAVIPCVLNIINFLGYPKDERPEGIEKPSIAEVFRHTYHSLRDAFTKKSLRRLVVESMGYEGVFHAVKDYIQPVLKATAITAGASIALFADLTEIQRTSILVGIVFFILHVLSSVASRNAHRIATRAGSEENAAAMLWIVNALLFAVLIVAGYFELLPVLIVVFVLLYIFQNFWRPVLISRFDDHSNEKQGATILSIESQSRRIATMALAPLLGFAIDYVAANDMGGSFWPLGAVGLVVSLSIVISNLLRSKSNLSTKN